MALSLTLKIVSAALMVAGLASCGGGGGAVSNNPTGITAVRVFGDSLADGGTFGGVKFTVNNAGPGGSATQIFPDLVSTSLGLAAPCPFFSISATGVATNPACKNLAVGGGRINNTTNPTAIQAGNGTPWSIPFQMATAAAAVGGTFAPTEMMLVDGGGNDMNDLMSTFAGAATGAPAAVGVYVTLLGTLIPSATVNQLIVTPTGAQDLAGLYAVALADKLADDITTHLLNKGAKKVVVVNVPAISNTPLFQNSLVGVPAANAAALTAVTRGATQALNAKLASRLASDSRVAIVDLFTEFDYQVNSPSNFALSNVTTPACNVIPTSAALASTDPVTAFFLCTGAALDASSIASSWKSYAFSDGFHPTPYGHVLAAQMINRVLAIKCWI